MELELVECATCYMPFGISKTTEGRLRKCHNAFYCPSGHANYFYGETQEEKLRKQNKELESRLGRVVDEKITLQKELDSKMKKKPARKSKSK